MSKIKLHIYMWNQKASFQHCTHSALILYLTYGIKRIFSVIYTSHIYSIQNQNVPFHCSVFFTFRTLNTEWKRTFPVCPTFRTNSVLQIRNEKTHLFSMSHIPYLFRTLKYGMKTCLFSMSHIPYLFRTLNTEWKNVPFQYVSHSVSIPYLFRTFHYILKMKNFSNRIENTEIPYLFFYLRIKHTEITYFIFYRVVIFGFN